MALLLCGPNSRVAGKLRRLGHSAPPRLVANVGRPAAAATVAADAIAADRRRGAAVTAFGKLEAECARDRVRLCEPQRQPLPDAVHVAAFLTDQLLRALVVTEIFLAKVPREQ